MKDLLGRVMEGNIWSKAQVYAMLLGHYKKQTERLWKPEVQGNKVFVLTKGGDKIEISSPVDVAVFLEDIKDGRIK